MSTDALTVDVVIRFSNATQDLVLTIDNAVETSALALKQRIRSRLDSPAAESRLRFIHSGKVIPDSAALSKSLNISSTSSPPQNDEAKSKKAAGKQPLYNKKLPAARVYIHCSVGDVLSQDDLAAEKKAAGEADDALKMQSQLLNAAADPTQLEQNRSTTTPAPRGFDRLLATGFTAAEVATLRTQFLAIQAHTHTPDTMPTGSELLALEERWLDTSSNPAAGGAEDSGGFGSEDAGGLEDLLYGNLIGFFWPVGAMCWLMREEGVWTRRRQIAVLSGFLVNLTFGFLRVMN